MYCVQSTKATFPWGWVEGTQGEGKPTPSRWATLRSFSPVEKCHSWESQCLRTWKPSKPRILCYWVLESLIESYTINLKVRCQNHRILGPKSSPHSDTEPKSKGFIYVRAKTSKQRQQQVQRSWGRKGSVCLRSNTETSKVQSRVKKKWCEMRLKRKPVIQGLQDHAKECAFYSMDFEKFCWFFVFGFAF